MRIAQMRTLLALSAVGCSSLTVGCGPDDRIGGRSTNDPQNTATVSEAVTSTSCTCVGSNPDCTCVDTSNSGFAFVPNPTPGQKSALSQALNTIGQAASLVASAFGYYNTAVTILTQLGVLDAPVDGVAASLKALHNQIDQVAGTIQYHDDETLRTTRLNGLLAGLLTIKDNANPQTMQIVENQSFWDSNDSTWTQYVLDGASDVAFLRHYVDSDTDGKFINVPFQFDAFAPPPTPYMWKEIVPYTESATSTAADTDLLPDGHGNVYDWRYALPALLQLDALRVLLLAAEESSFKSDFEHNRKHHDTLMKFHDDLRTHLTRLSNGLKCGILDLGGYYPDGLQTRPAYTYVVSCADIYSGLNETVEVDCEPTTNRATPGAPCPSAAKAAEAKAYNDVRALTPWFAVQSMVDTLYLLANGLTDLTVGDPAIHPVVAPTLCLGLIGEGSGALSTCSSSDSWQSWTYNRAAGTLAVKSSALCLDAQGPMLRTNVVAGSCNGKLAQEWSYDPEHLVLNNALGNALDVPVPKPAPEQLVDTFISADLSGLAQDFNVYDPNTNYVPERWKQQAHYLVAKTGRVGSVLLPSCASCVKKPLAIVSAGADGALYTRAIQDGAYSGPVALTAGGFAPTDAAIASGQQTSTQTDAFVVANDGKIYVTASVNDAWQAPSALTPAGLAPPGATMATASQGGQLGVAVVDKSGKLEVVSWTAAHGWVGPVAVTAANFAPPGAALSIGTRASGELDTFAIGTDGALKYMAYVAGAWSGPYTLSVAGFAPPGAPVATAVDVHGFLNVFTIGKDGALYTKWDATALWSGPTALTATAFAPPGGNVSAIKFANQSINAFVVDQTGAIDVLSNAGTAWKGPAAISAVNTAPPGGSLSSVVDTSSNLELFSVAAVGGILESIETGATWSAPMPLE